MWLDDGIEYIYAESEALDYGGPNEEDDDEIFKEILYIDEDDFDDNLYPDDNMPWGMTQLEAELYSLAFA